MSENKNPAVKVLKLEKIDLASKNPEKLSMFYEEVFGIKFEKIVHFDLAHYSGNLGGIELFLCPNEPAGVSQNAEGIQQFHIEIDGDLSTLIQSAKNLNCEVNEDVQFDPNRKQCCICDPDGNPWIISEK
ncbi:MAG: hypothetical protein COA79_02950 [Planctomycetota bacterium]|nr:MAG: hypothetical protein COA79_02950 [Planctomycetota bacterium]